MKAKSRCTFKKLLRMYEKHRRIYPKLRLSPYTLMWYIRNDWASIWAYLLEHEYFPPYLTQEQIEARKQAMRYGKVMHERLSKEMHPAVHDFVDGGEIISTDNVKYEIKITPCSLLVGVPDLIIKKDNLYYVVDYKFSDYDSSAYKTQITTYALFLKAVYKAKGIRGIILRFGSDATLKDNVSHAYYFVIKKKDMQEVLSMYEDFEQEILLRITEGELDHAIEKFGLSDGIDF